MASTYTSLAKITTFIFAVCVGSSFVCRLISMSIAGHFIPELFVIAVLVMAYLVLEYVGLHFKIPLLIIWSLFFWFHYANFFIRKLIDVSTRQPLKGWVIFSRISIHSINFITFDMTISYSIAGITTWSGLFLSCFPSVLKQWCSFY